MLVDDESEAFVDAPSEPEEEGEAAFDPKRVQMPRRSSTKSFVTASSLPNTADEDEDAHHDSDDPQKKQLQQERGQTQGQASGLQVPTNHAGTKQRSLGKRPLSEVESINASASTAGGSSVDAGSTSSLLHRTDVIKAPAPAAVDSKPPAKGILARVKRHSETRSSGPGQLDDPEPDTGSLQRKRSNLRNLVKFDIPEDSRRATIHLKAKKAQMTVQRAGTKMRRQRIKEGLVVKMERMLVRVDTAGEVPDEFDENVNQRVISQVKDKWREYMVVCRHSHKGDSDFVLQLYQTRVGLLGPVHGIMLI